MAQALNTVDTNGKKIYSSQDRLIEGAFTDTNAREEMLLKKSIDAQQLLIEQAVAQQLEGIQKMIEGCFQKQSTTQQHLEEKVDAAVKQLIDTVAQLEVVPEVEAKVDAPQPAPSPSPSPSPTEQAFVVKPKKTWKRWACECGVIIGVAGASLVGGRYIFKK